ncbi:MAG: helix-turn-helix transcriptional regulator [Candidatus Thorarchaeota archaeon]
MHIQSKLDARHILLVMTFILLLANLPEGAIAQDNALDIVMDDVQIQAILSRNGTSIVSFSANVTNVGLADAEYVDVRFDLRELDILKAETNGVNVSSAVIPGSNYAIVRYIPETAFNPSTSHQVEITLASDVLQESLGVCTDRDICLGSAIFYVRPLHEYRDLTFKATLPPHGILDTDTSPLFPTPTQNYTDGIHMTFVWDAGQILPGQERVFIIKYGTPNLEPATVVADINIIPVILLAAVFGAALIIVAQKLPGLIRAARVPKALREQGMTEHEEQVIQLLSQKGGSCSQRDFYDDLGMSQSLVSMVLTGLEQRGVIRRFREGRENIVHLIEE